MLYAPFVGEEEGVDGLGQRRGTAFGGAAVAIQCVEIFDESTDGGFIVLRKIELTLIRLFEIATACLLQKLGLTGDNAAVDVPRRSAAGDDEVGEVAGLQQPVITSAIENHALTKESAH